MQQLADVELGRTQVELALGAAAPALDVVGLRLASRADLRAVGVLHLGPVAPGGAAVLEGVGSTPLFHRHLPVGPVGLAPGQSADVPVVLEPARCDAHALADDERVFGPQLQLALDGAPAAPVRLWVPREDRTVATDALVGACSGRP